MRNRPFLTVAALAAVTLSSTSLAAPPLSGAIFTTDANGSVVNGNTIYADKCDVYLDGGPPLNAPLTAAGLPDGDYYFQVTDPSGKKLLSTDAVGVRQITVSNGIIVAAFNHPTNPDMDGGSSGAVVVQLCPYDDTPNNGGVYKAWVTPVGDGTLNGGGYVDPATGDCGNGCFHGFLPARSKTDNFKVGDKERTFCINVKKTKISKGGSIGVANWEITITDPLGVENMVWTGIDGTVQVCGLTAGNYVVTEALTDSSGNGYDVIFSALNGNEITPPTETVNVSWRRGRPDQQFVEFTNQFVCDKNKCP